MRRTVVISLILLLCGASVNIFVAWSCEAAIAERQDNWRMRFGWTQLKNGYLWSVHRHEQPGYLRISAGYGRYEINDSTSWPNAESLIEPWSRTPQNHHRQSDRFGWREHASGWPMLSMWSRQELNVRLRDFTFPGSNARVLPSDRFERAWFIDSQYFQKQFILPIGIIWPGFIANTLVYALLLWLLFFAPFALRRLIRRRRGLCERCAYPIGASPVCTECGTALRSPTSPSAIAAPSAVNPDTR